MSDVWKAIATGGITLVVGFVLLQIQLGGRRRRLRREITEELQLIERLGDEHEVARARVSDRVTAMLARYAPQPRETTKVSFAEYLGLFVGAVGIALALVDGWSDAPWWAYVLSGVATGALVAYVATALGNWWDRKTDVDLVATFERALESNEDDAEDRGA